MSPPVPACRHGYPLTQLRALLGAHAEVVWRTAQPAGRLPRCDDAECGPHGAVIPEADVLRALGGRGR